MITSILIANSGNLVAEYQKIIIVDDSIVQYLFGIEGVCLQALRGDTISRMSKRLLTGKITFNEFDYVIFHVGTNNVARNHDSDYGNLIGICRKVKQKINIFVCYSAQNSRSC